jgi:hypothetical protein
MECGHDKSYGTHPFISFGTLPSNPIISNENSKNFLSILIDYEKKSSLLKLSEL